MSGHSGDLGLKQAGAAEQATLLHGENPGSNPYRLALVRQELQATLEELDANRQELRSVSAELAAVNLELNGKLDELAQTNSDFNNLMHATAMPMVFLDRRLHIMRYTPRALDLFRLIPSDVGRPLSDLRNMLIYPELMMHAQQVLDGEASIEQEVREQSGKWFLARLLPYQAPHSGPTGVMLTFFDITQHKQSEAALLASEKKLSSFISATSDIVYEMSADWREMRSLTGKHLMTTTDSPRSDWTETYIPAIEKSRVWTAINNAIAARKNFELEHRVALLDGELGWVFSRAIPLLDEQGNIIKWYGTASDITERKRAERVAG